VRSIEQSSLEHLDQINNSTKAPAQHAIGYTSEELHYGHGPSEFTGDPRPEVDQAWSRLLKCKYTVLINIVGTMTDNSTYSNHGQSLRGGDEKDE